VLRLPSPTQVPYSPMQQSCSHYNGFCSITWHTRMHLCTWQQNITTIMQPSHRDLQPQTPKYLIPTHTGTTAQCRTPCRHQSHVQGTPAATASAAATTLPEKHSISRSGFRPNTSPHVVPCNSYAAITMPFASFCSITWHTRMHLRTWQENITTIISATTGSKPLFTYAHTNSRTVQNSL
jgi:hypothetical protein